MSRSLQKRLSALGTTTTALAEQTVEYIQALEADLTALREKLTVGNGELVEVLIGSSAKAFASEVDGRDFELLDKLLPIVWPECLVKLGSVNATDAETLGAFIDFDGTDSAEGIAEDIAKLERLKKLIDDTISLVTARMKARE